MRRPRAASRDLNERQASPLGSRKAEAPRKVIDAVDQRVGIGNLAVRSHPVDDLGEQLGEAA